MILRSSFEALPASPSQKLANSKEFIANLLMPLRHILITHPPMRHCALHQLFPYVICGEGQIVIVVNSFI